MTEIIIYLSVICWVAGFIRELGVLHAKIEVAKAGYPYSSMKYHAAMLLFVTWPYFYFYRTALAREIAK